MSPRPIRARPIKQSKPTPLHQQTKKLAASRKRRALARRVRNILIISMVLGAIGFYVWYNRFDGAVKMTSVSHAVMGHISTAIGINLEQLYLDGIRYLSSKDVIEHLALARETQNGRVSLLTLSPEFLREKLMQLGWVKEASVEREFPSTLRIKITEREPVALWQYLGTVSLIDASGVVITTENLHPFTDFPLLVGKDANKHAEKLFSTLATVPDLMGWFESATWIGDRRWDVRLTNKILVKLPEKNPETAWKKLKELKEEHKIFERDIEHIDLRIAGRTYIELHTKPGSTSGDIN